MSEIKTISVPIETSNESDSATVRLKSFEIRGTQYSCVVVNNSEIEKEMLNKSQLFEYTSAADPTKFLSRIPILIHPPSLHENEFVKTGIIPFDLSSNLKTSFKATSPNLLASFIKINPKESIETKAVATSQIFYVIRGNGETISEEFGTIKWFEGDYFAFPKCDLELKHFCKSDKSCALYWVSDQPLMNYLGVAPIKKSFQPVLFRKSQLLNALEKVSHEAGIEHRNRCGILLGHKETEEISKTVTPVIWSLLNVLPKNDHQRPHRHQSVALDLCSKGPKIGSEDEGKVYTLMGPELDEQGWVKNAFKVNWIEGGVFITPPGWWHSHHNESDKDAFVLPVQDAGLFTYQRTLNIQFTKGKETLDELYHVPPHIRGDDKVEIVSKESI